MRIKLSAIAAIICKSKTFHCASVPYYHVSRFRLKNLSLGEYYYLTTHFKAQIISVHVGMTTDNHHYFFTHYDRCIKIWKKCIFLHCFRGDKMTNTANPSGYKTVVGVLQFVVEGIAN